MNIATVGTQRALTESRLSNGEQVLPCLLSGAERVPDVEVERSTTRPHLCLLGRLPPGAQWRDSSRCQALVYCIGSGVHAFGRCSSRAKLTSYFDSIIIDRVPRPTVQHVAGSAQHRNLRQAHHKIKQSPKYAEAQALHVLFSSRELAGPSALQVSSRAQADMRAVILCLKTLILPRTRA